jgi:hypothetical protein
MARQARIGEVLVKSRETTGRAHTLPWWLGVEARRGGVKTTENNIHWPRWRQGSHKTCQDILATNLLEKGLLVQHRFDCLNKVGGWGKPTRNKGDENEAFFV